MKAASLVLGVLMAVCLSGCGNPELDACQQEKIDLMGQLDQAKATLAEKDKAIESLKTENVEMQDKAMKSITTMLTKQAEKDNQLKQKMKEQEIQLKQQLTAKSQQVKDLESQNRTLQQRIGNLETELQNQKGLYENMKKALQAVEQEKQALMKKINEIQKAAVAPAAPPADSPAAP